MADPRNAALQAILATRLARVRDCHGAACRERPDARLVVHTPRSGRCYRSPVSLEVRGVGVERVVFQTNGRSRLADARAPFVATLRVASSRNRVRVRVSSVGDRLVTVDRTLTIC